MAGSGWKWLESAGMAEHAEHGWIWMEMAFNGWKLLELLEIAGNSWK